MGQVSTTNNMRQCPAGWLNWPTSSWASIGSLPFLHPSTAWQLCGNVIPLHILQTTRVQGGPPQVQPTVELPCSVLPKQPDPVSLVGPLKQLYHRDTSRDSLLAGAGAELEWQQGGRSSLLTSLSRYQASILTSPNVLDFKSWEWSKTCSPLRLFLPPSSGSQLPSLTMPMTECSSQGEQGVPPLPWGEQYWQEGFGKDEYLQQIIVIAWRCRISHDKAHVLNYAGEAWWVGDIHATLHCGQKENRLQERCLASSFLEIFCWWSNQLDDLKYMKLPVGLNWANSSGLNSKLVLGYLSFILVNKCS